MNRLNIIIMKIKMFITSYFPLYVILLVLQAEQYPIVLKKSKIFIPATVFAIILIVCIFLSIETTYNVFTTQSNETYKYLSINRTGDAVISYMMTYIVPLLSESFLTHNGLIINFSLFVLIGIMYVKLDLVYFNPLWIILGYAVYSTDEENLIISNIPYVVLKQNSGHSLKSSYLVKGVYLIRKKDNLDQI